MTGHGFIEHSTVGAVGIFIGGHVIAGGRTAGVSL